MAFRSSPVGSATPDGQAHRWQTCFGRRALKNGALEVVFFGADSGEEIVRKDTPLEFKYTSNFARSMPIDDAMNPANLLCYEMNGSPLPAAHGFPLRLIAPGWYGVANVKWLTESKCATNASSVASWAGIT